MNFSEFKGMVPKVARSRRDPTVAQEATNTSFSTGALKRAPFSVHKIDYSDLKSTVNGSVGNLRGMFYSHQADAWFGFGSLVRRGVDSLIAPQDTYRRVYFADPNGVRFLTSDQYTDDAVNLSPTTYRLGVPAPAAAPAASKDNESVPVDVSAADVVRQKVFYVSTFVDQYGHEGPPSLASDGVSIPVEYPFQVTVWLSTSGSDLAGRPFGSNSKKRVYRSTSGSAGAHYQYVGEIPFAEGRLRDGVPYGEEGELIPTSTWYPPPAGVTEIDAVASNFLAGFYDNMVCFSEVKLPHAWPYEYRFPLRYKIVAIQSTANGMFIGTTGKPYWAFGADPQAAVPQELDYDYACVDRDSVADVDGVVMYASHDGLVAITGSQAQLLTEEVFTHTQWKHLISEGVKGFSYEGGYSFYSVAEDRTYAIDVSDPYSMVLFEPLDTAVVGSIPSLRSTAHDMRRDRTILVAELGGAKLMEVTNAPLPDGAVVEWRSDVHMTPRMLFTAMRVRASRYPVTIRLELTNMDSSHAEVVFQKAVQNEDTVRLPPMRPSSTLSMTVDLAQSPLDTEVYDVDVVSNVAELKSG